MNGSDNMKIKTKTEKMVDLSDWNDLVRKTYGRQYSFQQQDGCKDRGVFYFTVPEAAEDFVRETLPEIVNHEEMGVSFAAWLARDPKRPLKNQEYDYELELWWDRNFYPDVQMIANDLHSKGHLKAGRYGIVIDW